MAEGAASEPYFTTSNCTGCGVQVDGLHGRWTCAACGACSPYAEPPEGWQSDIGFRSSPEPPPKRRK